MTRNTTGNGFVKMRIGKTRLLVPAAELLSIETADQTGQPDPGDSIIPENKPDNIKLPVYTANEELQFSPHQDGDWSCCVCLDDGQHRFGIICDEADLIDSSVLTRHNLPGCMKTARSPVSGLTVYENTAFCNTDTASLFRLLDNASSGNL